MRSNRVLLIGFPLTIDLLYADRIRDGVNFSMRLFSGNYSAILKEVSQRAGEKLESSGSVGVAEIVTIAIADVP